MGISREMNDVKEPRKKHYIKSTFVAGVLVVVPLILTLWVTLWAFRLLTAYLPLIVRALSSDLAALLAHNPLVDFGARFISLLVVVLLIYLVGLMTRSVLLTRLVKSWERLLLRLPVVSIVYSTMRQVGSSLLKDRPDKMFSKVVIIEYPRKGVWAIGFLSADAPDEINRVAGVRMKSVFVPTTPNPTSGFLLLVPVAEITILTMSVADGMRLVISGGAVPPGSQLDEPRLPLLPESRI